MKRLLALNILIFSFLLPFSIFGNDFLLIVNGSAKPDEKPHFIGSFSHLQFEKSSGHRSSGSPAESIPQYTFQPRNSLTHNDRNHIFLIEEEESIYEVEANLVYGDKDSRCLIYMEKGSKFDNFSQWEMIGRFFDRRISSRMDRSFGTPSDIDKNGKTVILYYSFLDDTMLGYFSSGDLESINHMESSNEMEILYMNIEYGSPGSKEMMETLPHEYMHLINYTNRQKHGYSEMDLWMDEGLAESATEFVMRRVIDSNLEVFSDSSYSPWTGTALCTWEERDEDYALSYLFMQYLKIQAGTSDIFRKMINHPQGTAHSLPKIMKEYVPEFDSFHNILKSFYLALILKEDEGIYGFKSMNKIYDFQPEYADSNFKGYLYPGGAVYLPLPEGDINITVPSSKHIMVIDSRDYR
ncbi:MULTISPECIES: hypothetical protein [unclassified Oceanispirochaeta]|uniref:hypothetical protein n=1 Tax=unclassified Oceanispirochaeta TaxID=2635722 RepID=UPI000E0939D3|nr:MULTISPECIES: hypothetical protein [unclassified Oceanispirochaeta]MBF9014013.1 hypothetical protein [Oceanispirochaeta sp. M2]NPD70504.1 hypothetical protein [Oceanispirochaeta sp. M1]RDG34273.1 hypothetical protein DV872_00200 [Oceanispirochaeta sp. M1]